MEYIIKNPEITILAINSLFIAGSYLLVYPTYVKENFNKLVIFDIFFTIIALMIAGLLFVNSEIEFNAIVFKTNWFWFTLLSYFIFESFIFYWYKNKYKIPFWEQSEEETLNSLNEEGIQMEQSIKDEAIEQLEKDILFGFDDKDELLMGIRDMFYDVDDFDKKWLKNEIKIRLKKHKAESKMWERPTDFDKLLKTFDTLNKNGIVALHKAGYTKQDGEEDSHEIIKKLKKMDVHAKGFCYYHTQDLERVISEDKNLFIGYDSYNHDGTLAKSIAQEIIKTLKFNGLKVKWDESIETRIEIVDMDWKKTVDVIDYNQKKRIFKLMKNSLVPK